MNYTKMLKLTHFESSFRMYINFAILGIVLSFTACDKDCNCPEDNPVEYPSLKVENQLTDYWRSITAVSLVGYEFSNLNIEYNGDSQTFVLDKGMPGGYEDIYIKVKYIRYSGVISVVDITVDFQNGETTTIALKGCDAEGCPGFYLEYIP